MNSFAAAVSSTGIGNCGEESEKNRNKVVPSEWYEARIRSVTAAQREYASFSQQRVDEIFAAASNAARLHSWELAEDAVAETGMGVAADKEQKNRFAADVIYRRYRNEKTANIVSVDRLNGITTFAEPVGVIAGIVPLTNPTSTTIFKALLALKTRNGIIFFPHPRAKTCTINAARVVLRAAVNSGAPKGIIDWIDDPSADLTRSLIRHDGIALIMATGGSGVVKEAYCSGKPAIGVGSGNTPAIVEKSAAIALAVDSILESKLFDNGLICASEQSVIVDREIYKAVKEMFQLKGAYMLSPREIIRLRGFILEDGRLNAQIIGQSASKIAEMIGVAAPKTTKLLVAEVEKIGASEPLSCEKLSPILAMYRADDFKDAVDKASKIICYGGLGHTASLHIDLKKAKEIRYFTERLKTARLLLNCPSSQGAIGGIYNSKLDPSLTLGCGSWGGNSICGNVGVKHLLNMKTLVERRG